MSSNTIMTQKIRELYLQRFENMLKPLQSRLSELEQNLDSIKNDHPDVQKARLDVLTEINKAKAQIENVKKNFECAKEMPIIRSDKVPVNIPDHNVWNDCWYDEKRKAFVTFNQRLEKIPNARTREIQIQYDKEIGVSQSGIILEDEKIEFRYGYPVILRENQDGNPVWFLLPTMTDNMLSKQVVKGRFRPQSNNESVIYKTESEEWIEVLNTKLSEREYEIACEVVPYLVKTPIEILKATANRPYDQKLFEQQMTQMNSEK